MNVFDVRATVTVDNIVKNDTESYDAVIQLSKLASRLTEIHDEEAEILHEMKKQFARITLTSEVSGVQVKK